MADNLFIMPLQQMLYELAFGAAITLWQVTRSLILAGFSVQAANSLSTDLFGPAISQVSILSQGLMPTFLTIAALLLGISYLLAPYARIRVVNWQKAVAWMIFGTLFFQYGPGLYVETEAARRALAADLFNLTIQQSEAGGLGALAAIQISPDDVPLGPLVNNFGGVIPGDNYVDGLDIALAYVLADAPAALAPTTPLPPGFQEAYFPPSMAPVYWLSLDNTQRNELVNLAFSAAFRMWLAWAIAAFGVFEQLLYLALSLTAGALFLQMAIALPLALFERTELLARSILDMWLELFIFSLITAVIQAFIVGMVTAGARTLNPALALGSGALGGLVMLSLLLHAFKTLAASPGRLFSAMSQATGGGHIASPLELAGGIAGAVASAALAVATGGASAAVTAAAGGSLAQVAGSALSGSESLFHTAALGSMVLPEDSPLRRQATGFYEGALASRLAGPAGGLLLRENALSAPDAAHASENHAVTDAVSRAMERAVSTAPTGGYASSSDALQAVRQALGESGRSNTDIAALVTRREDAIGQFVQKASAERPEGVTVNVQVSAGERSAGPRETQTDLSTARLPAPHGGKSRRSH